MVRSGKVRQATVLIMYNIGEEEIFITCTTCCTMLRCIACIHWSHPGAFTCFDIQPLRAMCYTSLLHFFTSLCAVCFSYAILLGVARYATKECILRQHQIKASQKTVCNVLPVSTCKPRFNTACKLGVCAIEFLNVEAWDVLLQPDSSAC